VLDRIRAAATAPGSLGARLIERLGDVGGVQQATVLGAQAFTSLIPYLVVASTFVQEGEDESFADRIIDRFDLEGRAAEGVRALFASAGEVESAITVVGLGILLISVLSFARTLQGTYERSYRLEASGLRGVPRSLLWLTVLVGWLSLAFLRQELRDLFGPAMSVTIALGFAFVVWLGTPVILLGSRVPARRLVPGAMVSAVVITLLLYTSAVYMPILIENAASRYGLIGVAFSLQGWLLTLSFAIVAGAVVGGVLSEDMASGRRTESR
jgi:membrane protein